MNFNARVIPSKEEKAKLVESTYTSSITTRTIYPTETVSKKGSMDFQKMVKCLGKGVKACRPTWKKGEFLWKKGNVLVHNTPYWKGEVINQHINGYPYVVKQEDINANDWEICKEGK